MAIKHESIGIKQAIRFEWMQKAANLQLAGISVKDIRDELHEYLQDRMGSGARSRRSPEARSFAVSILMNTWITPDPSLEKLRDSLLLFVSGGEVFELAAHWIMLSAAYPFWFNVAKHTGRLLGLQNQVTMKQITSRMIEEYGDRQTVSRNAQFVVRSFVYWGVLIESAGRGCLMKANPKEIFDRCFASLMFEAALHASSRGRETLGLLFNSPSYFPFLLPSMNGDTVLLNNERIEVLCYGSDDELLKLKERL